MYLDPSWRVLTIGDGDLSFSRSLARMGSVADLTASVYDSRESLLAKYADNGHSELESAGVPVLFGLDVTRPESFVECVTKHFDAVIFQFPLLTADVSSQALRDGVKVDSNLMNRQLLRWFLEHCHAHLLDDTGAGLAIISSKDVQPYRHWNLESSLAVGCDLGYLGKSEFDVSAFPGYRIRNVERDKKVKNTQAYSYYFGRAISPQIDSLQPPIPSSKFYCPWCRVGPAQNAADWQAHLASKSHQKMAAYEQAYQQWLFSRK
ncbi:Rossmann-like fold-containing protein [Paraferrimonas sedimenticola]|uniref:25S rRNA (uridine-N(3))-methyltransferase BMT5-like domain-containing protein n=1 Tax=Paraferrimonas sedimenticola TaxID=375674 RepID=A0AA37VWF6_9GAMM|nr:Rossmann-like fold-containing protein [Paraferrimonas sedimenticola]GLP94780.1 hypothetical protein GCM10007895_00860 [Paraferrimonas sedimenticola]